MNGDYAIVARGLNVYYGAFHAVAYLPASAGALQGQRSTKQVSPGRLDASIVPPRTLVTRL